jgi:BlaI family transcriptional regulator, penicillinase repressor
MEDIFFTDRELDVMSVLWKEGSGTVAEVRERITDPPGYTTILKILQILEEKGFVTHEEEGRAYRYLPLVHPEQAGWSAARRIVNKIFHGSAELLVAQLVSDRNLSPEALERMRKILDETTGEAEAEAGADDAPSHGRNGGRTS